MTSTNKKRVPGWVPYTALAAVPLCAIGYVAAFSDHAHTTSVTAPEEVRDNYEWSQSVPDSLNEQWSRDGYTKLVNSPGAIIAGGDNSVTRLDSVTGEDIWEYRRDNASLCDVAATGVDVTAVFNSGNGCSELVTLDGSTGEYIAQAQYSTTSDVARIVYGRDRVGLVTENMVRVLRQDLVPVASFGDRPDTLYADDQAVSGCQISDTVIGPNQFVVASRCDGEDTFHVRALDIEPDEASQGNVVVEVDSGSTQPVTLGAVTSAHMTFVVAGTNPSVYTWQITGSMNEVANRPLGLNEFAYGYQDISHIGYVWRIGENLHVRYGSEDLSQYEAMSGVIGEPIEVDGKLAVPTREGLVLWDTNSGDIIETPVSEDSYGRYFGFSGGTYAVFNEGEITGFRSGNEGE